MEAVLHFIDSIQTFLQVLALGAAAFAMYELIAEPDWRRRVAQTIARVWVIFLCGLVGISGLFFGQNGVLTLADWLGAPLAAIQGTFVASLVVAVVAWMWD